MSVAQKISISLAPSLLAFIDHYAQAHTTKGRSAVVTSALALLQRQEQDNKLAAAYAQSAGQDLQFAGEFDATLADGLKVDDAAW